MEVKIISGFGENIFQMPEESVWDVLKEASKQAKNSLEEKRDAGKGQPETKAEESEAEKPEESVREYIERQRQSRVDNIFGSSWRKKKPADMEVAEPYEYKDGETQEGYSGFLLIKCEKCGKVKGFCTKNELTSYKCECGHETHLEKLRPLYLHCKCGAEYRYKTNLQTSIYVYNCLHCGNPVDVKLNNRKTAYVTSGGALMVITVECSKSTECLQTGREGDGYETN